MEELSSVLAQSVCEFVGSTAIVVMTKAFLSLHELFTNSVITREVWVKKFPCEL